MSKNERTGWRDEELSKRHRLWGMNCPAVDIDFLMLEYDNSKPVALIEYKNNHSTEMNFSSHPSYKAMGLLSNNSKIPFMVVRYSHDFILWEAIPINEYAKRWVAQKITVSEQEYVELLYKIRGRKMPDNLFPLNHEEPTNPLIIGRYLMEIWFRLTDDDGVNKNKYNQLISLMPNQGDDAYKLLFVYPDGKKELSYKGNTTYSLALETNVINLLSKNGVIKTTRDIRYSATLPAPTNYATA